MSTLVLTSSSGALQVTHFRAVERVSTPFSVELWASSADSSLDLSAIVGHPASFRADAGHIHASNPGARVWSGLITHGEQLHALQIGAGQAGTSSYRFSLAPDLWILSQRRNNRIFQHESIPDIVEKLLREWSVRHAWHVDRSRYPKLEFKVQYAESDQAFVARLLEEAGIAFTFTTDEAGHSVLALSDGLERAAPRAPLPYVESPNESSEEEFVTKLGFSREVRPGSLTVGDYDPRHPALKLLSHATPVSPEARLEQMHYHAGAFLVETGKPAGTPVADDRGFARHDPAYGNALAERMLQGERLGSHAIDFDSNAYDLAPGSVFVMDNHPHDDLHPKRPHLVLETLFEGRLQGEWSLSAVAVPADVPYRTPRRTPKPRVHGVQSATVVGPAGQEIHVDELGRVRVELHWDRAGHHNERSSCWVRVSQGWGGAGYGTIVLPRIGQEVFLAFLEGDPDQPVVTGRAFNAMEQVPYKLPLHKTRSTWKSDSSPGSGGFNEVMVEDLAGKELVWQQAQKDRTRLVKNDELATVGHDRQKLVKHDEAEHTDGERLRWVGKDADGVVKLDRRERIERDSHVEVRGEQRELVRGDQSLTVVGGQQESVRGSFALRARKQVHAVAEEVVGEGAEDVTVAGPGGFLRIDASGITIEGTLVKINVSGSPGKGRGSKPELPEEVTLDKMPAIFDLRWSARKVPVGEVVKALFRVKHFKGDETALVQVLECNADGSKKQVDEVRVPIKRTDGQVSVEWVRTADQAEGDIEEDEDEGDLGPLEYRFEVEAAGLRAESASGPLWLTNTVIIELAEEDEFAKDGTKITLITAEGVQSAYSNGGQASFHNVPIGTISVKAR